jgi:hypothetical protein
MQCNIAISSRNANPENACIASNERRSRKRAKRESVQPKAGLREKPFNFFQGSTFVG